MRLNHAGFIFKEEKTIAAVVFAAAADITASKEFRGWSGPRSYDDDDDSEEDDSSSASLSYGPYG